MFRVAEARLDQFAKVHYHAAELSESMVEEAVAGLIQVWEEHHLLAHPAHHGSNFQADCHLPPSAVAYRSHFVKLTIAATLICSLPLAES